MGDEGASALELPRYAYKHSPAYVDEKLQVVEYVRVLDTIDSKFRRLTLNTNSTIGAGDTFIAGMLYGLTCHAIDWDLEHKLGCANELAGRKVVQEGFSGLGSVMQHAP